MRWIDATQHPTALSADKAANSHVDIGWSPLFTVKALLVSLVLGLDFSDGQTEPVILLALAHGGLRHPDC